MDLENLILAAEIAAKSNNSNRYHEAFAEYKQETTSLKYDQMEAILCLKNAKYNWKTNPGTLFRDWFSQQLNTQRKKWDEEQKEERRKNKDKIREENNHSTRNKILLKNSIESKEQSPLSLTEIVNKLISNIEQKAGTRWTSGLSTDKVEILRMLDLKDANDDDAIEQIMAICQIRRHRIHFWSEPASVSEFKDLLRTNDYSVPGEKLQLQSILEKK
jgi:hypothetical protein